LHNFARHFGIPQTVGTKLPQLDFCALARSQGVGAIHVGKASELDAALSATFKSAAPMLVEVDVEPSGAAEPGF
jgi:benzoylformate decarboxylase